MIDRLARQFVSKDNSTQDELEEPKPRLDRHGPSHGHETGRTEEPESICSELSDVSFASASEQAKLITVGPGLPTDEFLAAQRIPWKQQRGRAGLEHQPDGREDG